MKPIVDEIIVIPVGPSSNINYIQDTLDSIIFYTKSSYVIIVIEDIGEEMGSTLLLKYPFVKILKTEKNIGMMGGLYITLSIAYRFALENYDFKILLKLDTDALMIGNSPEKDAIEYFEKYPRFGMLGSYKIDCNGEKREYKYAKNRLLHEASWKRMVHNWKLFILLHKILKKALKNGYEYGESCLGGAYFISKSCLQELMEKDFLQREEFKKSDLGEDHIFGLFIRSIGFEIGDFVTGNYPICVRHRGLPCSPEELVRKQKKLTHSTRFWENMNEEQIRLFFRNIRKKEADTPLNRF